MRFIARAGGEEHRAVPSLNQYPVEAIFCGEDVSVVGYDDMLLARLSTPALTTIEQDTLEAGRRLVSQVMDAHSEQFLDYLPTHLIARESCGA
ncbi:hypothetical protein SKP52_15875 [Sphingopyxis fribergensis]|uniref:Transcriptional regulator LacI/GalR-like sensor domain-containing protein n=1 Tax=Sphingopyxis fribergensis TaxID=1515612 RepID=A0A0A7PIV8_9SPHN|nr:substrate-binding domain-containing protein [Sphingopyxis fribergensis]AJA10051.1 hypothetical protein SKP52_15875 [Sphingopyxis fribergensis]